MAMKLFNKDGGVVWCGLVWFVSDPTCVMRGEFLVVFVGMSLQKSEGFLCRSRCRDMDRAIDIDFQRLRSHTSLESVVLSSS